MLLGNANFINMLCQYDANNVPIKVVKHVQKNYTEHPEKGAYFSPETAKKFSAASVGLVQWVAGVVLYRTIL